MFVMCVSMARAAPVLPEVGFEASARRITPPDLQPALAALRSKVRDEWSAMGLMTASLQNAQGIRVMRL